MRGGAAPDMWAALYGARSGARTKRGLLPFLLKTEAGKNLYYRGGGNVTHGTLETEYEQRAKRNGGHSKRMGGGMQF